MVFSAPIFLFAFLPLALGLYFAAPRALRNLALLLTSLFFYAWGEKGYVFLMLASIGLNYGFGRWIEARRGKSGEQWVLAAGIALNLLLLVHFKYTTFLVSNLNVGLVELGLSPVAFRPIHLPIGISFFTFEAIAYLVDIRRGETPAQRNPIDFGLFMTLFPHLIAGPVVRYRDLAAAIAGRSVTSQQFAMGIRRFVVGLAKKVLLANTLGQTADELFLLPASELSFSAAWLGALCYALHIYFDFSGYSDMAIGLGRFFGFELCENFRYPYAASSVTDFWRRWHISLSTWFRDYLYIPLGGNRCGPARTAWNLFAVFALCGLWHGANWTFLIWGLFHGLLLSLERTAWGRWLAGLPMLIRHGYALLAVTIGWVFFRADSLGQALGYLGAMFGRNSGGVSADHFVNPELALALGEGLIFSLPAFLILRQWRSNLVARGGAVRIAAEAGSIGLLAILAVACTARLAAGTYNPFIYFRF